MKLTKLLNKLSPRQKTNHGKILDLAMKSKEDRKNNANVLALTQMPAAKS